MTQSTQVPAELPITRSRWSSQSSSDRLVIDDPATGEDFMIVQGGGAAEVDAAIRAARAAQPAWAARTPRERGKYLYAIAAAIREHADEIAAIESREMGKPLSQARMFDVEACIALFEYFGRIVESFPHHSVDQGHVLDVTVLEPLGVIGSIFPFNWTPIFTAGKVAPALAVGNAVVIKPPEQGPLAIMRLVEIIGEVLPDDVVHVVPGGPATGLALTSHRGVDKLSFTGSTATGVNVLKAAAENLTPTLMELGSKNGLIVFDDADLDLALAGVIDGGYFNQGEACTASSRVIVQRGVYAEFVERLAAAVGRLRVGDGADPRTHVGPLVSKAQQARVLDYIEIGKKEGARLVVEAALPTEDRLKAGYFVAPTLFADVAPDMRIAQEEIFGPVVTVIPFDDEDDAVRITNGTEFGLVAGVYTNDSERQLRVSRSLQVGMVFVNNYNRMFVGFPFGGTKHSGHGREHCPETLQEYGYTKTIRMRSGRRDVPVWAAVSEVLG